MAGTAKAPDVVVPEIEAGRRKGGAFDAFDAGNIVGVRLGLNGARNSRQDGGDEVTNGLGFHGFCFCFWL